MTAHRLRVWRDDELVCDVVLASYVEAERERDRWSRALPTTAQVCAELVPLPMAMQRGEDWP